MVDKSQLRQDLFEKRDYGLDESLFRSANRSGVDFSSHAQAARLQQAELGLNINKARQQVAGFDLQVNRDRAAAARSFLKEQESRIEDSRKLLEARRPPNYPELEALMHPRGRSILQEQMVQSEKGRSGLDEIIKSQHSATDNLSRLAQEANKHRFTLAENLTRPVAPPKWLMKLTEEDTEDI